jgi:NADPH2:quinone reductase
VRAIVCERFGPLEQLQVAEREPLVPGPGQLLVEVKAAGVNFVDGLMCQGGYQMRPPTPFVPGSELAGLVSALGEGVSEFSVGDRVMAMPGVGAFAEQALVPAASAVEVPRGLGLPTAACLTQSYATALYTLTRRTKVEVGEWVLVLGAGGGVGLAAVDVASALGARVVAAASSGEKLSAASSIGAEETIPYEEVDLKARVREITGGGADVVIDTVGGRHSEPALRATRTWGRFCVIGFASGTIASVPLNQILLNNRTVVGVDWGAWAFREPEANAALVGEVARMVAEGRLSPSLPAERPLGEAASAMQDLLDRRVTGKVALVP